LHIIFIATMKDDYPYIERCKQLAASAGAKGNHAVGAVITKDAIIISEAEEATKSKNDVTCHAEIEAIRIAVEKTGTNNLSGCVLYSTHEPCIMCAYAIRFYAISKVVFLHKVNYLGSVSSPMPLLTSTDVPPHWSSPPSVLHLSSEQEEIKIT
jgi:tRNA(adenine34) deaminase